MGVYADEAFTGTKESRPEFQKLIADCRAGKIDMIITKSISRFARNAVTLLETVRELKALNISVYFEEQNIDTLTADGEFLLTILAAYAQEESLSVSENCLWSIQNRMKKGKMVGFIGMYGYNFENGVIRVNEEQAAVIRQMFAWYIGGIGITAIAHKLNEQGITAYMGDKWHPARVNQLLCNEKLTGNSLLQKHFDTDHLTKKQRPNRGEKDSYYVENTHPAIISEEIFHEANRIRQERASKYKIMYETKKTYVFGGMIVCGNCGKKYRRKKCRDKFYWQCFTFMQDGKSACPAKQIPENTLINIATEILGLAEFDETMFKNKIAEIRVPSDNHLAFVFSDGTVINREWKDKSRSNSWTEDMKQDARERRKNQQRSKTT